MVELGDAGKIGQYIAGAIGFGIGYLSSTVISISTLIRNLLLRLGILGTDAVKLHWLGLGVALLIYLAVLGFGWKKKGLLGWFLMGFGLGAILEEVLHI